MELNEREVMCSFSLVEKCSLQREPSAVMYTSVKYSVEQRYTASGLLSGLQQELEVSAWGMGKKFP